VAGRFDVHFSIDTFTKYGWARIVEDKTAEESASTVQSDNGNEFKGDFDKLSARQNSMVERFNKTLKGLINKWMTFTNGVTIDDENHKAYPGECSSGKARGGF